jgi:hypothetical protein
VRRGLALGGCALLVAALLAAGCRHPEAKAGDAAAATAKPPVEASATVDRAVATTGDLITYRVTVEHDPGYQVDLPEPGADIAGFRIVDLGRDKPKTVDGRVVEQRWYKLRADLVGSYVLPPVTVHYRKAAAKPAAGSKGEDAGSTVNTSEIFVEVESVLPADGAAKDIHDIKPLEKIAERPPWLIPGAGALGALALAAAAFLWWRRRRLAPAAPPRPAHEIAFAALDALRRTDFSDLAAVRRYYFAISEVVRAYVEGRFGLNATDLTSEEIASALPALTSLDAGDAERLTRFLTVTDGVKFAARVPDEDEIQAVYEDALSFVEATRPRPEPEPAAVDAEPPAAPPPGGEPVAAAAGGA